VTNAADDREVDRVGAVLVLRSRLGGPARL